MSKQVAIEAERFPPYLVTESWPQPEQCRIASQYIEWIAPSLLTLPQLSQAQRERLEKCLHKQAVSVEHHWHLYPQVINQKYLTAARVQCRIQDAQG